MPTVQETHSFEGGMNKDTNVSALQNNQYYDANNITISLNEEQNVIALTNLKGNKKQWAIPFLSSDGVTLSVLDRDDLGITLDTIAFADLEITSISTGSGDLSFRIIGYTTIRNILILLARPYNDVVGMDTIWTVDLNSPETQPVLKYIGDLGFPLSPIDVEGNYESETVQKVYWADGVNELGHFNIADPEGYKLNSDKLTNKPKVELTPIIVTAIGGSGEFNAGSVQYLYQYYDRNGNKSVVSPATNPIPIAEELDKGNLTTDTVSRNFSLSIEVDTNWEYIMVYRVLYSTNVDAATSIDVIIDQKNINDILFTDDGRISIRTVTQVEITNASYSTTIPNSIKSKDQRLIIAGYTENIYNPDWDARAYRFPRQDTDTVIQHAGSNYTVGTGYQISGQDVPKDYDNINPSNTDEYFDPGLGGSQMYRQNSIVLGASGPNVIISFDTEELELDQDDTNVTNIIRNNGGIGDAITSQKRSWKRDEIYRVAVILTDNKGAESQPLWMCDLRMPDCNTKLLTSTTIGVTSVRYLYPTFTFSNLPDDCVGVKIVRVERTESNKTIISQGYISPIYIRPEAPSNDKLYPVGNIYSAVLPNTALTYEFPNSYSIGDIVYLPTYNLVIRTTVNYINGLEAVMANEPEHTVDNWNVEPVTSIFNDTSLKNSEGNVVTYQKIDDTSLFNVMLVKADRFVFHSPTLEFTKTITKDTSNYFSIAQILNTNVSHSLSLDTALTAGASPWTDFNNVYHCLKAVQSAAMTGTYDKTIAISDTEILADGSESIISNKLHKNIPVNFEDRFVHNTALGLFVVADADLDLATNSPGLYLVDLKVPLLNQYGGNTYSARLSNTYILASEYKKVTAGNATVTAKYGDTFITEWNHMITYRNTESDTDISMLNSNILVIESDYDITKRLSTDLCNADIGNFYVQKRDFLRDTFTISDGFSQYINPQYNIQNIFNKFFPIDESYIISDFPNHFKASELKFNGEITDSWLNYFANNFLAVEGKYGPINAIEEFKDTIIFFQDDAIGQLSINPKYSSATSEGALIVGTGGILDDYAYISTNTGTIHRESIVKGARGLYYYDDKNKKIRMVGDEQQPFSDVKGLHAYLKENMIGFGTNCIQADGVTAGVDQSTNKIYFTFHTTTPITILVDETIGNVESFVDCHPLLWISTRQGIFSGIPSSSFDTVLTPDSFYQMGTGDYGVFYGVPFESYITIIGNDNPLVAKEFFNLLWISELFVGDTEYVNETFNTFRAWNRYQDTFNVSLNSKVLHNQFRKWHLAIPRNLKHIGLINDLVVGANSVTSGLVYRNPVTNYLYVAGLTGNITIADTGEMPNTFTKSTVLLDRIRDFHTFFKLSFTNNSNKKLILHPITINYNPGASGMY